MFPTPPQKYVLDSELLTTGFNCILQLPTGAGKTWLAERAIDLSTRTGFRAIYLAPTRALAAELYQRWKDKFNVAVGIFTGDYGTSDSPYPVSFSNARILIMTPERLDACTRHWRNHWHWIPQTDLIVVDELHLLGDGYRGARLEGALSRFLRLNPFSRVLGLSATLGNLDELANWLKGVSYKSDWRPIPLSWRAIKFKSPQQKPQLLVDEVHKTITDGGQTLVFVQSRRRAEQLDQHLQANGIRSLHHHAGLNLEQRALIEQTYHEKQVDVLVATPTLEVGVNLPTRKVVLYDLQQFNGHEFIPLSTNQVWQRVGRAGRPGFDLQGEAILFSPTWDRSSNHYEKGKFEPINSQLKNERSLSEQIIAEVASGLCRTRHELANAFSATLASFQQRLPSLEKSISAMCTAGMLVERVPENSPSKGLRLYATRLGRIVSRQMLSPATIILFRSTFELHDKLTLLDLLILAACSDDCEPVLPVDFEELEELSANLQTEPSWLLTQSSEQIKERLGVSGKRLLSACKMALIIRQWTRQQNTESLAQSFNCYEFEVVRLRESLLRLLPAMNSILQAEEADSSQQNPKIPPLKEWITALNQMVTSGLDETQVTLTLISGIGPKLASRLVGAGIADIEDLTQADPDVLAGLQGVSLKRANLWINDADNIMRTHTIYRFWEDSIEKQISFSQWPKHIDPYRLRRALDLKVKHIKGNLFRVTGGLDPHNVCIQVDQMGCDCSDFSKGHVCKHLLAVRHSQSDQEIHSLVNQLTKNQPSGLDLFSLWYDHGTLRKVS